MVSYKRGLKSNILQGVCIVLSAAMLFFYLNYFASEIENSILSSLVMVLFYTFPLIFVEGLYGLRSAMLSYTLVLIPTVILSPGDAFLLTFHLVLIFVLEFCMGRRYLKTIGKTLISGCLSGIFI